MKRTQMLPLVKLLRFMTLCFVLAALTAYTHTGATRSLPDQDHRPVPILEYGRGLPQSVQWSPQGDTVLVTTAAGMLWRYDAHTLETIDRYSGIVWARYSPSGSWLFTQDTDQTWAIRRADNPNEVIADGFSRVWQHSETAWLMTIDAHGTALRPEDDPAQVALGGLESVHVSPDGVRVLTFDPSTGFILRDANLNPVAVQPDFPDVASGVHWSPDGTRIALLSGTDRVDMVGVAERDVASFTVPDQQRYTQVQWSSDSKRLLDSDDMGNGRIWDAATRQLLLELPTGEAYLPPEERTEDPFYPRDYWSLRWSTDSSHIFRCVSYDGDVYEICRFYDSATGTQVGEALGDSLGRLQTDPERRYFIASEGVFDAATGQLIAPFDTPIDGGGRTFSPDGQRVALASIWRPDIHIYDLNALQLEHSLDIPPGLYSYYSMNWSPDGAQLATWGHFSSNGIPGSGLITFWDAHTGREAGRITEHILFGQEMAFSADSSQLAAADNLGNISLFDTSTGDVSLVLSGLEERASILAWQPGGTLLAATTGRSRDYIDPPESPRGGTQVRVWDTGIGNIVATLEHSSVVLALLWHPEGRLLITDDNTGMSIWNAETGERTIDLRMTGGGLTPKYRWTRDGRVLVRGHYNCTHGGGDSLNFLDMTTLQHFGTIDCSGNRPYEWREAVGGIPSVSVQCESTTSDGGKHCRIHISILLLEPQNEERLGRFHSYDFGQFDEEPQLFTSPDESGIAVVTDSALQLWQLEADRAALLWSGEPAANIAWSSDGKALALVTNDAIRIVSVENGSERVVITAVSSVVSNIEWSQDDAFILVQTDAGSVVFDAASGGQVPLPEGVEHAHWESGFLRFSHPADGQFVWWDVRTERVAFIGDPRPMVVSRDGRFGAEIRSGVLRMWKLPQ